MSGNSAAGNFDLDHAYLRATVAAPLTEAMAQLAILQPEDPVEYLGNYLLKFVSNELEHQRINELKKDLQQQQPRTAKPRLYPGSSSRDNNAEDTPSELDKACTTFTHCIHTCALLLTDVALVVVLPGCQTLVQEKNMLVQLQAETSVPLLFQRFLTWLCAALNAEEAYIGKKSVDPAGVELVHWVASSKPDSITVDKFVTEERGVTFDVFKEVDDPASPVDADGNPLPPMVPKYIHVENVLREPRMKFFHVPKLGAYLTKGLKYNCFLHPDVFNETSPETPNIKEDWLVVSVDTMGQARSFTQPEIDSFQRSCAVFIQSVEELERTLYMRDFERKTTNDDALLHEFHVAYAAQVAVQEENLMIQLQSLPEEEKNTKEVELRAAFMMYLLTSHVPTLAMASARIVPFKQPVLTVFAAALGLLGYPKPALFNLVTKAPCWEKIAPLLEETRLKVCLEGFPVASPPVVADAKQTLSEVSKADIEAGSPIAFCFYLWVQAVIAHRENLDALAELARQQEADAAAAAAGESEERGSTEVSTSEQAALQDRKNKRETHRFHTNLHTQEPPSFIHSCFSSTCKRAPRYTEQQQQQQADMEISGSQGEGQRAVEETAQDIVTRERERLANLQTAKELADAEQQRRVDEAKDREDELAIVRQINIELSKTAQDEEQERRVREYEIVKVQEQLLRERSKSDATEAAEQERLRRMAELETSEAVEKEERAKQQKLAVQVMEKERIRRLSSQEHFEHMASRRKSSSVGSPRSPTTSPSVYFSS